MKKVKSSGQKLLVMLSVLVGIIAVVVAGILLSLSDTDNEIKVFDRDLKLVATIKENGDISYAEGYSKYFDEYISVVVDEVVNHYTETENIKYEQANKKFFRYAKEVYTNLDGDVVLQIAKSYQSSKAADKADFASVVTDVNGRILGLYGKGSEEQAYCLYKTYAGSAIKPLSVYAPAIESGRVHWSSAIKDEPFKTLTYSDGRSGPWPSNANGEYTYENILLVDALKKSINTVAVKLLSDYSVKKSMSFLERNFAIDLEHEKNLVSQYGDEEVLGNIALGYLYEGVSSLDMAGFYQIFANGGMYTEPYAVISVKGEKGTSYETEPETKRVLSAETSKIMVELLKGVLHDYGTAKDAYVDGFEVAGKSGTSDNYKDNWFVGCTPDYVCSVWHSNIDNRSNVADEIFGKIIGDLPVKESKFPLTTNVTLVYYCKVTGLRKGNNCQRAETGYYNKSNIPPLCNCGN
jgi:penicillin-binding protein 1A